MRQSPEPIVTWEAQMNVHLLGDEIFGKKMGDVNGL